MKHVKQIAVLLIIALMISVVVVMWPIRHKDTSKKYQDVILSLESKVKRAEKKRAEIIVKAREDSAKQAVITKAKDAEITRLKQAVRKYRTPHVDTVLIQYQEVGRYAATLDSIVVAQDSQIAELKEQKVEQWNSFNKLIMASDSTLKANQELNNYYLETERKANKQLRRSNNLLKVGIVAVPLAIVGGIVLLK